MGIKQRAHLLSNRGCTSLFRIGFLWSNRSVENRMLLDFLTTLPIVARIRLTWIIFLLRIRQDVESTEFGLCRLFCVTITGLYHGIAGRRKSSAPGGADAAHDWCIGSSLTFYSSDWVWDVNRRSSRVQVVKSKVHSHPESKISSRTSELSVARSV